MPRGLIVLPALLTLSTAVMAQQPIKVQTSGSNTPQAAVSPANADDVVARVLSFDRDHDGTVAMNELSERMWPIVARGDLNKDGALDAAEIRALAVAKPTPAPPAQGPAGPLAGPGKYAFDDESALSPGNHIENAIEDLRLAPWAQEKAVSIAKHYADENEAKAAADLLHDLEPVLPAEQLNVVQRGLQTPPRTVTFRTMQTGAESVRTFVVKTSSPKAFIAAFQLASVPDQQARAAVDRYEARLRLGESERAELVDQLKDVLSPQERDDLAAALARRPVVANDMATLGGFMDGNGLVPTMLLQSR